MITKAFTYESFSGEKVTKEFTFHMSRPDMAKFRLRKDGSDFVDTMAQIMETENARAVLDTFEDILRSAVGHKSEDGERFIKNDDARSELFDTPAYDAVFTMMMDEPKFAAEFITAMLPKDMQAEVKKSVGTGGEASKEELLAKLRELEGQDRANKE